MSLQLKKKLAFINNSCDEYDEDFGGYNVVMITMNNGWDCECRAVDNDNDL